MIEALKNNMTVSDEEFDEMYPPLVRNNSKIHWTPVEVAKRASSLLVDKAGVKVLDVGAGSGKFCIIGATQTEGIFTGVEQREHLVLLSNQLIRKYELRNTRVICTNITSVDFSYYDAFYIYNPFIENLHPLMRIDDSVYFTEELYVEYTLYVAKQLKTLSSGTRVVTYCSSGLKVPLSYKHVLSEFDGQLDLWIKE